MCMCMCMCLCVCMCMCMCMCMCIIYIKSNQNLMLRDRTSLWSGDITLQLCCPDCPFLIASVSQFVCMYYAYRHTTTLIVASCVITSSSQRAVFVIGRCILAEKDTGWAPGPWPELVFEWSCNFGKTVTREAFKYAFVSPFISVWQLTDIWVFEAWCFSANLHVCALNPDMNNHFSSVSRAAVSQSWSLLGHTQWGSPPVQRIMKCKILLKRPHPR